MNQPQKNVGGKRIVVALDTSPPGLAALEAAAKLAARLEAELHGLFVEDDNLLRLADLPFAHEIDFASGAPRPLDRSTVETTLRATADRVRQAVAKTAHRESVRWSFQVTRGRVTQTTLAATAEVDAVIMGRESSPLKRLADPTQRGHQQAIMAIYDGSTSGERVLETAAQLATIHSDPVAVVATATGDRSEALLQSIDQWGTQHGLHAMATKESLPDAHALAKLVDRAHAKLVLLNRDHQLLDEETIETLVNELDCPIGLVR